jgi:hypothetical protein
MSGGGNSNTIIEVRLTLSDNVSVYLLSVYKHIISQAIITSLFCFAVLQSQKASAAEE